MFENVVAMGVNDKRDISRFLEVSDVCSRHTSEEETVTLGGWRHLPAVYLPPLWLFAV